VSAPWSWWNVLSRGAKCLPIKRSDVPIDPSPRSIREGSYHLLRAKTPFRKKRSCFRAGLKNAGIDKQNCLARTNDCPVEGVRIEAPATCAGQTRLISSAPSTTKANALANAFQGGSSAFFSDSKNLLSVPSVFLVQFSFLSGDIALHAFRDSDRLTFFNLAPPLNRSKIEFLRANLTLLSRYFFPCSIA
jgi:hypothetical protein